MLRASVEASGMKVELKAVADPNIDSGIAYSAELLAFADAVTGSDRSKVTRARGSLRKAMGAGALVQAAAIAANFSMNDRVANAIGIVLEGMFLRGSEEYRIALGIDGYPSARNTLRPSPAP